MKSYLLAFFTLAAAVTTVAVNGELMTKKEYVALFTKKLNQKKAGHSKRERYDSDTCRVKVCGDNGDLCPSGDIVCSGYLGCFNGTCTHSKPGDKCIYYGVDDDTCYSSSLRCYKDRCVEYAEEGDRCTYENEYDCKTKDDKDGDEKLYCSASKSRDIGVCRKKNLEVGDECDVDKDYCNRTVSYCAAADGKTVGKCVALPDKLDKPCNTSHGNHGCNGEKLLYCNPKTEKCVQFPMAGERCTDSKCYPGYYCSGSFCKERKEINETCSYYNDHECKDGLVCAYDSNIGRVCKNNNPKEGEFCNSDIVCPDGLACENNTCVKKTWECKTNKDCPDPYIYHCVNETCKGGMNIGEGEECWLDDDDEDDVFSQVIASLHCKKGLACVPKVEGIDDYNHVCKKSYTSIDDLKYCSSSNGCPYDSICECNDIIGKSVCVPIVVSSKKLKKLYDKLVENEDEENYDPYIDMVDYLKDNYLRHDSKFRCDAYLKDAASVLKASVFVTIALAFLALF